MKNKYLREDILSLLNEIRTFENDIKFMVWREYYSDTEPMPESFPWKKKIREELNIVI